MNISRFTSTSTPLDNKTENCFRFELLLSNSRLQWLIFPYLLSHTYIFFIWYFLNNDCAKENEDTARNQDSYVAMMGRKRRTHAYIHITGLNNINRY